MGKYLEFINEKNKESILSHFFEIRGGSERRLLRITVSFEI